MTLNGRVCVVTGGARGIGRAIVQTYAAADARAVYALDTAFDGFDEVTAKHASVKSVVLDVTDADAQADEFVEITGGGDFPKTWDFEEDGDLVGTFSGTVQKEIKGKERTLHNFSVDDADVTAWGAAILDSRLADVEPGSRVKVVKSGDKLPTKSGRSAWEFKVFVAKGSLNRGR